MGIGKSGMTWIFILSTNVNQEQFLSFHHLSFFAGKTISYQILKRGGLFYRIAFHGLSGRVRR